MNKKMPVPPIAASAPASNPAMTQVEQSVDINAQLSGAPAVAPAPVIGVTQIRAAADILREYKQGKTNLEERIIQNEQWYKLRHWEYIRAGKTTDGKAKEVEPASAWLFNSLANKHADAMDNFPEPNILPREQNDEMDAEQLTSIVPVVLERNDFEETYSRAWWYKLKNGCVPYGVFFDTTRGNGLGDICVKKLDLLNLFWQPGITDIQNSPNFFIISTPDIEALKSEFPGKFNGTETTTLTVSEYIHDESIDKTKKTVAVDWYYKRRMGGRTILHFAKFVGDTLLFASENDTTNYPDGFYAHGKYPIEFDVLFPEEDMPTGFGYIDVMREPQMYIDKLDQIIMMNALRAGKNRYVVNGSGNLNEEEFTDLSRDIVHTSGALDERNFKELVVKPLDSFIVTHKQMKIDEIKETSGNRDFSQGGTSSGVTAAAAIAALAEAGNKLSRDMIKGSYRSYKNIVYLVIEDIRQFYDEARAFRIVGEDGAVEYLMYKNERIKAQLLPLAYAGQEPASRVPIFDIVVKPQRQNPFTTNAQNDMAIGMYKMGFFDPARAEQALIALDMMSLEGKEKLKKQISANQTMYKMLQELLSIVAPQQQGAEGQAPTEQGGASPAMGQAAQTMKRATGNATTSYAQKLAGKATPNVNSQQGGSKVR